MAKSTQNKLTEITSTVIPHPPDLPPLDYYLLSPTKNSHCGKTYRFAEEVHCDLENWFALIPAKFYANGIKQFPECWKRCVEHKRNYFQHFRDADE